MLENEQGTILRKFHNEAAARAYIGGVGEMTAFVKLDEFGKPASGFLALHDCAIPGGALHLPLLLPQDACTPAMQRSVYNRVHVAPNKPAVLQHWKNAYPNVTVVDFTTGLDVTAIVTIVHDNPQRLTISADTEGVFIVSLA